MTDERIRALATESDGLDSVSGIHMVEGENQLTQVILLPLFMCCGMLMPPAFSPPMKKQINVE